MAGEDRAAASSLIQRLESKPYSFYFFQCVRRLEVALGQGRGVGLSARPTDDPVRFCQEATLAFSSSTISAYVPGKEGIAPRLYVSFMGLLGPNGPLPGHITEFVRDRKLHHDDLTLSRFLDLFNHRMVSLYYRAWACSQPAVQFDRPETDRFSAYVGSLLGLGMKSLLKRDAVPDVAKLHYAGRLGCETKNAAGLQAIFSDYFCVQTEVLQFFGHWMSLPADCCCRLGESEATGSLGTTTIVGSRFWDCQQKFRVRCGPMGYDDYKRLLPQGESFKRMVGWVRNYVGDELSWDVQLILRADETPRLQLGEVGQLGWTTWLSSQPLEKDQGELVLTPMGSG